MVRFISIVFGLLILLIVAAVFLLPRFVDEDKIIAIAADAVKEQSGATLEVMGDLDITVFPVLGVAITQVQITMPEKDQPDLELASANIGVQFMPLLSGEVKVNSIEVNGATARVDSAPDESRIDTGKLSDAELEAYYNQRRQAQKDAQRAAGAQAALAVPLALTVASLKVTDTRVEMRDTETGEVSIIELTELNARDLNLDNRPIPLNAAVRVPGEQPILVNVAGDIAIDLPAETASFPKLAVDISGATPKPLALLLAGTFHTARQTAEVDITLKTGDAKGAGKLRYASFESPQIDADLHMNLFDPVLFVLAGPEAAQDSSAPTATPAASGDEPLPLDALRAIDTRATLKIDKVHVAPHDITDLTVKLRANEGVINLRELRGDVYGGKLDANANFNGRLQTATLQTSGGVKALDIAAAMAAMDNPDRVTGLTTLSWELSGKGKTANELTASLSGPIQLGTENVALLGTSVEKLLCQAVALTNQEKLTTVFPTDTAFTDISATITLSEGNARLQPLNANLEHVTLSGNGNFNLLSQDFNATFKARLSPGLEELDRACRVSKRLTAIDFPVNCKGNIATAPGDLCRVDSEKIVRDMAVNEGKKKVEKEAGKLFNKFFNKNKD